MASPAARAVRRSVLASLFLLAVAPKAFAVEERIWVSAGPSASFYDPEQALKDGPGLNLQAAGFLNRWVGVQGTFLTAAPKWEEPLSGDGSFTHFGAGLIFTPDRYRWNLPYLYAGLGSVSTDDPTGSSQSFGAYHLGGGMVFRAGERLGFRLDGSNVTYEQEDGAGRDTRVNTFQVTGAVSAFWMGRPRDTDVDGVPDKKDKSPATPAGAVVDATGTPLDTDKDGVYDGLDKSPATPLGAKVDLAGVAIDGDADGVADGIDRCDSTAVGILVDAQGCGLDTDGDKIFDGPDKCADTPAGAVVDSTGCPIDADKDGIADGVDICPHTPSGSLVNAGGCPIELTSTERQLVEEWLIRLTDLEFLPDTTALAPAGMARLDSVGIALAQWPMAKIEIASHVDNSVEPGYRVPLSTMRVRAVLQYLLRTYPMLDQKNYWITGFGDTEPLVPNTSEANRRRNRRIEFKVMNMNVLQEERAKREGFGTSPAPPTPGLQSRATSSEG
jgi:outer membrane protein OmpA-like peptidoglycan-associated protein